MTADRCRGRLRVTMVTEGTYPFSFGGVANWCDLLVRELDEVQFDVVAIVGDADLQESYRPPANVVRVERVPLWGIREALECQRDLSFAALRRRRSATTEALLETRFVPHLEVFLRQLYLGGDVAELRSAFGAMCDHFRHADLDGTFRSRAVWNAFLHAAQANFAESARRAGYDASPYSLADLTDSLSLLYRWLMPLAAPRLPADLVHAVSGGLSALVGVAAKLLDGTPFLLTEHGIYLRERYLGAIGSSESLFVKMFSLSFMRLVTGLSYAQADVVAPGSKYNQQWERALGAPQGRLQTIYNGVDPGSFSPEPKPEGTPPTVVSLGRITPIKDILTLLRAAALVKRRRPDVVFRVYGKAPAGDEGYFEDCLALVRELRLENEVSFAGHAPSVQAAYRDADVVVLSSISEGFPYSIVEALLCGRPVVASAVGGVSEAIDGCGIAVEPRNPAELAEAIVALMNDPERRAALGLQARARAAREFNLAQCSDGYRALYARLAAGSNESSATSSEPDARSPQKSHPSAASRRV